MLEVLKSEEGLASKYFVAEHSWPLYVHHKLCCDCGSTICHLVMTSFQASHNMESWQKYGRNCPSFLEGELCTFFVPVLQGIPVLTPSFRSGLANVLITIHLIKGF